MKVTISFTMDTETDKDLLHWYNSQSKRAHSRAIRDALRANLAQNEITLGDVYDVVLELKRNGVVAAGQGKQPPASDEPADIVDALNLLGL